MVALHRPEGRGVLVARALGAAGGVAAVQIAPRVVPANFIADPINARQVAAGRYLAAVRALGSPAYPSYGELTTACARLPIAFLSRERCWRSAPTETFAGTRPLVVLRAHGRISADNLYWRLVPAAGEASMDVSVPAGGELLFRSYPGSGVSLYLRFAATFPRPSPARRAAPQSEYGFRPIWPPVFAG